MKKIAIIICLLFFLIFNLSSNTCTIYTVSFNLDEFEIYQNNNEISIFENYSYNNAVEYSLDSIYKFGDIVVYNNIVYRCEDIEKANNQTPGIDDSWVVISTSNGDLLTPEIGLCYAPGTTVFYKDFYYLYTPYNNKISVLNSELNQYYYGWTILYEDSDMKKPPKYDDYDTFNSIDYNSVDNLEIGKYYNYEGIVYHYLKTQDYKPDGYKSIIDGWRIEQGIFSLESDLYYTHDCYNIDDVIWYKGYYYSALAYISSYGGVADSNSNFIKLN